MLRNAQIAAVAAGLRVVSPADGLTVASGQGMVKKSTINFGNAAYGWAGAAANASGYQGSKNGELLTEAFVLAFNQLVARRELLTAAPAGAAEPAAPGAVVAAGTVLRAAASADAAAAAAAAAVRSLRAGTQLDPTGIRSGLFAGVKDNFGTSGWVSAGDLK